MTQEDKDIIHKDACGRILYKPYAAYEFEGELIQVQITGMEGDEPTSPFYGYSFDTWGHIPHNNVRLYLRPMSSMTEEEKEEMHNLLSPEGTAIYKNDGIAVPINHFGEFIPYEFMGRVIQYLLEHHFDFMGLIQKGLALEVTKENNPYAN